MGWIPAAAEPIESLRHVGQGLRMRGHIPVGSDKVPVSKIAAQQKQVMGDGRAAPGPLGDPMTRKGMAQIVEPRSRPLTTRVQALTHEAEVVVSSILRKGATTMTDEQMIGEGRSLRAQPQKTNERGHGCWVQRQYPLRAELARGHMQGARFRIEILNPQLPQLANPQSGAGAKANQRLIDVGPQRVGCGQMAGALHQQSYFGGSIKMGSPSTVRRTEQMTIRDLGAWIKRGEIARKSTHYLQTPGVIEPLALRRQNRPPQGEGCRQGLPRRHPVREATEIKQQHALALQRVAETMPLREVAANH
jgi:hypothetical protein